jgi:hypothetical protein
MAIAIGYALALGVAAWVFAPVFRAWSEPGGAVGAPQVCPTCGPRPEADARYCSTCGQPVPR